MRKTLEELKEEFGYDLLTNEELVAVQEGKLNWNSVAKANSVNCSKMCVEKR